MKLAIEILDVIKKNPLFTINISIKFNFYNQTIIIEIIIHFFIVRQQFNIKSNIQISKTIIFFKTNKNKPIINFGRKAS